MHRTILTDAWVYGLGFLDKCCDFEILQNLHETQTLPVKVCRFPPVGRRPSKTFALGFADVNTIFIRVNGSGVKV